MSNKTRLQANNTQIDNHNTDLQSLIEQANSLPDAGGGTQTVYIGTAEPTTDVGVDGDIYIVRE